MKACGGFNIKYPTADTAKVSLLRELEKQFAMRIPLDWIPAKLRRETPVGRPPANPALI